MPVPSVEAKNMSHSCVRDVMKWRWQQTIIFYLCTHILLHAIHPRKWNKVESWSAYNKRLRKERAQRPTLRLVKPALPKWWNMITVPLFTHKDLKRVVPGGASVWIARGGSPCVNHDWKSRFFTCKVLRRRYSRQQQGEGGRR